MVKVFQSTSRYDMGIDASNVRLGWSITSSRRALYQTAYHIVITDEQGNTAWDSGWVESAEQVGIVARNLKPETIYTVKVRIKDETGRESAFSEGLVTVVLMTDRSTAGYARQATLTYYVYGHEISIPVELTT